MPLSDEQKAAVTLLKDAPKKDVADALRDEANDVYNLVFGAGVTKAKNEAEPKLAAMQEQLDAATEARAEAEQQRDERDPEKLNQVWQTRHERELAKKDEEIQKREQRIARLTTETTVEKLQNAYTNAGYRPTIAEMLAKIKKDLIEYGEDGKPGLKDPETGTPIQIPSDKDAFRMLAEQDVSRADPADLISRADRGGGSGGGAGGGGTQDLVARRIEQMNSQAAARPNPLLPRTQTTQAGAV